MSTIINATIGMGILGLFWAIILVLATKKLQVTENPLVEQTAALLPGVNCGACGFSGCSAYADAIVEKNEKITLCPVSSNESKASLAKLLGKIPPAQSTRLIAKLHCSGTKNHIQIRAFYQGVMTCIGEHITTGGSKACTYGCLGHGDCIKHCPFDALKMGADGLPIVIKSKCTGCGHCVEECPRNLLMLTPEDQQIFVLCSSEDLGAVSKRACKAACIACGICVKEEPSVFKIENNLAKVNYVEAQKLSSERLKQIAEKCPQRVISLG